MINFSASKSAAHDITIPDLEEFMTTQEAAEKLGYSVLSIRNMVYQKT
jgi:hypothetical protein